MKMKLIKNLISVVLIFAMSLTGLTVYAVDGDSAKGEIPYSEPNGTFSTTYAGQLTVYTADEAAAAGLPGGYSDYVLRVQPGADGAYAGYDFDFSAQNIPVDSIESITFRVLLPTGHTEMRLLAESAPGSWVMRKAPTMGEWSDLTLSADGTNFMSGKGMSDLANSSGNLGRFCLIGRLGNNKDHSYYLDSITIKYKEGASTDTVPPVITYTGDYELNFSEGDKASFTGLSAYDEYDGASAAISYEWSVGAVNGDGTLKAGTHTCTVKATDRTGNSSSISITVNVVSDPSVINLDTIPYTDFIQGVSIYRGTVQQLSNDEAAALGVPAGYTGNVLKVSGTKRFGMTFDPTSLNIPIEMIDSINIRIFLYEKTNAFRLSNHADSSWVSIADATGSSWMEYSLKATGEGFSNSYKMGELADENGNLGVFGIATKDETGHDVFYIDSIVINLKKDTGNAPVISYDGDTNIRTSSGKPFVLDISVHDDLLGDNVKLDYEWSAGALDVNGNLTEGEHTCRVSATNYYGHTSYLDFNVSVGTPDVTAPEILFEETDIYVPTGTIYSMSILAIDDYDKVVVEEKWSAGAIDFGGRLSRGEHTLTLTVVDLSGNKTTMTVRFHVSDDDPVHGQLVQG